LTVISRHVGGRGRPQDDSTYGQRTQSFRCNIRYAAEVSQRRTAVSSKCFQLYYTCSDRIFAVVLPPCPFHRFPPLTVTFPKLTVILRPLYFIGAFAVNQFRNFFRPFKNWLATSHSLLACHPHFPIGPHKIPLALPTPISN
jgi:hypothetical protein